MTFQGLTASLFQEGEVRDPKKERKSAESPRGWGQVPGQAQVFPQPGWLKVPGVLLACLWAECASLVWWSSGRAQPSAWSWGAVKVLPWVVQAACYLLGNIPAPLFPGQPAHLVCAS